jgi:23S rRNA (adenine2030-N6)-methyltransferase
MFVVNPPYTFDTEMRSLLPWLVRALGQDEQAAFRLEGRAK